MDTTAALTLLVLLMGVAAVSHAVHVQTGLDRNEVLPGNSEESMTERLMEPEVENIGNHIEEHLLASLLRALMIGSQRETRSSVLHHPQRFGRGSQVPVVSQDQIPAQDWEAAPAEIWSMAVPQRFGKK
ncbi:pro-FMRFamide-related neuropeptide FF like [Gouania willdenowi]|uniref:Uncharacterized protein n=1 Tax=Gouania willdenowi TaxID=441366 RepID=A0A8C5DTB7_GOUWI|nr:pro-FMRFamide-related neuropeptide FF [Gouania willdenowi]